MALLEQGLGAVKVRVLALVPEQVEVEAQVEAQVEFGTGTGAAQGQVVLEQELEALLVEPSVVGHSLSG